MKEMVPPNSISVNPLIVFGLLRGPRVRRYSQEHGKLVGGRNKNVSLTAPVN